MSLLRRTSTLAQESVVVVSCFGTTTDIDEKCITNKRKEPSDLNCEIYRFEPDLAHDDLGLGNLH